MAEIAICVPSQDVWKGSTGTFVTAVALQTQAAGHTVHIVNHQRAMVFASRNDIVHNVLSNPNIDYLMWIDSDMVGDQSICLDLLKQQKDIVGVRYCRRTPPNDILGNLLPEKEGDLSKALSLPGGCILVKADVYRTMRYPWYFNSTKWAAEDGVESAVRQIYEGSSFIAAPGIVPALENALRSDEAIVDFLQKDFEGMPFMEAFGEDTCFCKKAVLHGFDVWAHTGLEQNLGHLATVPIVYQGDDTKH